MNQPPKTFKKFLLLTLATLALLAIAGLAAFADDVSLNFAKNPAYPAFESQEITLSADDYNTISLKLNCSQAGTARLLFSTTYDPQFNAQKSLWFFLSKGEHTYYFNVPTQNQNWMGFIKKIVILPDFDASTVIVSNGSLGSGNFFTTAASGWQEFWGPRGRLTVGSTINTIQCPLLFGRSIYVYIYWLLSLAAVSVFCVSFYQTITAQSKKKIAINSREILKITFLQTGLVVFWMAIGAWLCLQAGGFYNYALDLRGHGKYFGKEYREQLAAANFGDFYPFIEFVEANLPKDAAFDFQIGQIYGNIKAIYYLYPHEYHQNAAYLIVYDQKLPPEAGANYHLWKEFRPGAAILLRNDFKETK